MRVRRKMLINVYQMIGLEHSLETPCVGVESIDEQCDVRRSERPLSSYKLLNSCLMNAQKFPNSVPKSIDEIKTRAGKSSW